MKYAIDKQENVAIIDLMEEKLDSRVAPALKGEFVLLNSEGYKNIILSLEQVKFADSSGLSALLVGNRLCDQKEGVMVLYGITPMVQKIMEISQLTTVLNIVPTRQEALDAVMLGNLELELEDELRIIDRSGAADEDEEEEEFDDFSADVEDWDEDEDDLPADEEWDDEDDFDDDLEEGDEDDVWDDDDDDLEVDEADWEDEAEDDFVE